MGSPRLGQSLGAVELVGSKLSPASQQALSLLRSCSCMRCSPAVDRFEASVSIADRRPACAAVLKG